MPYTLAISLVFLATAPPLMDSTSEARMSWFEAYIMYFISHSIGWTLLDVVLVFQTLA